MNCFFLPYYTILNIRLYWQGINLKINLKECITIFFDLEFYVPESSRDKDGLCYNPWDKSCRLLGGEFLSINGLTIDRAKDTTIEKKIKGVWLWDHSCEKEILEKILSMITSSVEKVKKNHNNRSLVLCGIGISNSDIPVIFELFKRYKLLSNDEAFELQANIRVIDLAQISILLNNVNDNYIYPLTKNSLLNKYLPGEKFESGKSVWDLYENKKHAEIIERTSKEIVTTYLCYKRLIEESRKLKSFEKRNKSLTRQLNNIRLLEEQAE